MPEEDAVRFNNGRWQRYSSGPVGAGWRDLALSDPEGAAFLAPYDAYELDGNGFPMRLRVVDTDHWITFEEATAGNMATTGSVGFFGQEEQEAATPINTSQLPSYEPIRALQVDPNQPLDDPFNPPTFMAGYEPFWASGEAVTISVATGLRNKDGSVAFEQKVVPGGGWVPRLTKPPSEPTPPRTLEALAVERLQAGDIKGAQEIIAVIDRCRPSAIMGHI